MSKNTENRFVGTNWDDIKVSVGETSARKVITKGNYSIESGDLIAKAFEKLRQGYEVRFLDELGEDAIRIYPVVTKGKDTMEVCTRAMGGFKQTLSDKRVKLASLPKKDEEAENEDEGEKDEEVTPDQLVTCPKCHKRFRVGKKAAKSE